MGMRRHGSGAVESDWAEKGPDTFSVPSSRKDIPMTIAPTDERGEPDGRELLEEVIGKECFAGKEDARSDSTVQPCQ
jgi:hypothetical protein